MACKTAFVLALLIAASQAAPQGRVDGTVPEQANSSIDAIGANLDTSSSANGVSGSDVSSGSNSAGSIGNNGGSSSGEGSSSVPPSNTGNAASSNTGNSASSSSGNTAGARPPSITFPQFPSLLPSFNFSGAPASANNAQSPIAAIISVIPTAINEERERVSNAVQQLISQQLGAATDSIGAAAQTGGQFLSNGAKIIASWPAFWANLLG